MQLVVLHHHLNRGGVTSVIENHLRSLATLPVNEQPARVTIAYGGRDAAWKAELAEELPFDCCLAVIPELDYDNVQESEKSVALLEALRPLLEQCDRDSTVLHFHNHSLGKNWQLTQAIGELAEAGWRCLLQVHDFAEDLRPSNYRHLIERAGSLAKLQAELYPQAEQIHYSVLNHRDLEVFRTAGLTEERLHLLPNPVKSHSPPASGEQHEKAKAQLAQELDFPESDSLVLYPVRPIRRKNLGEFLLWSVLAERATFALTLAPMNPEEQKSYQHWVALAGELELPVRFELASKSSLEFAEVYAAADAIITTSVAEGFGLVYLEAALAHKQLVGRNLPSVCRDFEEAGMSFPDLAASLAIPTDQIDRQAVLEVHRRCFGQLLSQYGLESSDNAELSAEESLFSGDVMDFARLNLSQQSELLRRVNTEAAFRERLRELNPHVTRIGAMDRRLDSTHVKNCQVIAEHYSPEVIGRKLSSIYQSLLKCRPSHVRERPEVAQSVLNSFVHPSQILPLRLES